MILAIGPEKSDLLEDIENYEHQLEKLKAGLKDTAKHMTWGQLDEKDKSLHLPFEYQVILI